MKKICCACGKLFRMSAVLGDEGHRLAGDAYACYDCCKRIGVGKGIFGAMGVGLMGREEFLSRYSVALQEERLRQKEEAEVKRRVQAERQAKIDNVKKGIYFLKNTIETVSGKNFEKKETDENINEEEIVMEFEDYCIELEKFIVYNPNLVLDPNEVCYYQGMCCSAQVKNVVAGTSGNSIHLKGVSMSQRSYDRKTITERYPGIFFITNQRMVCSAPKLAFEVKLTNITSLTTYSDALTITVKNKSYIVETEEIEYIKKILYLFNEIEKQRIENEKKVSEDINSTTESTAKTVKEENVVQLLREYKALFDEGIITEDEFLNKKKQLLQ